MPNVALQLAVEEHLQRVSIEASHALPLVQSAARAVRAIAGRLALGQFVGPVLADAKPRLLLCFRAGPVHRWPEEKVVLKVYGDAPRAEGPLQSLWRERGVSAMPVLHGQEGPCSWILMPHVALRPLRPTRLKQWLAVTDALAAQAPRMHDPAPDLAEVLRPLGALMLPRLRQSVANLARAGHKAPAGWESRAADAYSQAGTPLHGDLALANLGRASAGALLIYDASALLGPPGFDAARWAARASSRSVSSQTVLARWTQHEQLTEADLLSELLAAECLLEAGARCEVSERSGSRSPDVAGLLRTASAWST